MLELDDSDLLKEYVEHSSEEAFAALVARHVNKVYSIALRHTTNPHQAEEITQAVFVILARKSRQLGKRVILSGWLCRTARLAAVTFVRSEIRRSRREQEAHMQNLLNQSEAEVWPQIAALLDAAMEGLSKADHDVVVLRFFDGKSMREIGAAFGASEDAAKMRVNRAVEKLRTFFTRRGIVCSAAALTAAISENSVQAAPLTMAAAIISAANGTTTTTSALSIVKGMFKSAFGLAVLLWGVILGGTYLSLRGTIEDAKSPRERQFMLRVVWFRIASLLLIFGLAFGLSRLEVIRQPFNRDMAMAAFLFGMALYSAALFEFTNRRRRQIQFDDGTWAGSDWTLQTEPQSLLTSLLGNTSRGTRYAAAATTLAVTLGLAAIVMVTMQKTTSGFPIRALPAMILCGIAVPVSLCFWRRRPRFDVRFSTLVRTVGSFGLMTLLCEPDQWATGFRLVVALAYALLIGVLAWRYRTGQRLSN
jgi:RNA polymerase sigma factor (sigma-70 family)